MSLARDGPPGKEESRGNNENVKRIVAYRQKIEKELKDICNDVLDVLDKHLIPHAGTSESTVFYHKMKGDYFRYLAEFTSAQERNEAANNSSEAYKKSFDVATSQLLPTHPIRLGLALNYSVFFYEIMNSPAEACDMAKKAFDEAIAELDSLNEEQYKDSTLIMQLLRDNLNLWTSDLEAENEGDKAELEDVEEGND